MENKKLTFKEIKKILDDADVTPQKFYHDDFDDDTQVEIVESLGKYKQVFKLGGGEGGGEDFERVYFFTKHDVYVCIKGSYYSGEGVECDDSFTEVFPIKINKIVYETKNACDKINAERKKNKEYHIYDKVTEETYKNEVYEITGIKFDDDGRMMLELKGDWSGGTNHAIGKSWVYESVITAIVS